MDADFAARIQVVIDIAMNYIVELLVNVDKSLPADLRHTGPLPPTGGDDVRDHVAMLYNDESHSYQEVITALNRMPDSAGEQDSRDCARIVDKEGRCPLKFSTAAECQRLQVFVERNSTQRNQAPLLVRVISTELYGHQQLVLRLLQWLNDFIEYSAGVKAILCKVTMSPARCPNSILLSFAHQPTPISAALMRNDVEIWKGIVLYL